MPQKAVQSTPYRWKPLIICPHAEMAVRIRSTLAALGLEDGCQVSEYPKPGAVAGMALQHDCNLCFLDVASNQEHALALIAETASVVPVVALNPHNDADLILRCLRRGACEFVSDATAEQVGTVLERLSRLHAPADLRQPGLVYCVIPGKPGCGASTLAVHLAIELKRSGTARVLLVDADSFTGSIAFLLKLKPSFHLGDAVRDCLRLDKDLWARLVSSCHGIDVLAAPENPAAAVPLDRPAAIELVRFWRDHYDAIVLDVPGAHGPGCDLASLSDEILLVTTNELAALHATRRSISYLEQSGIERAKLKLLVTRYTPATGLKREDVETALKLAPFAVLSNDYEAVQNAVLEGKPVAQSTHFGRSVHALLEQLMGRDTASKKRPPLFSRLSRRT
jgi:Flp pilus assembly CpaE family ATPase